MTKLTGDEYDRLIDYIYGEKIEDARLRMEFMEIDALRDYTDVETIPDCDSREDFLEMNWLQRMHDTIEGGL